MELHFDNLRAIRVLGRGATGTVFLAADRSSPSSPPFALKVVDKHRPSANPDAESRARRELSVLSVLLAGGHRHPFLPSLIGFAESPDLLAFAIPFCPAGDLHSLRHSLSPDRLFSISAVRFYLSELISALSHLHSLGIVYRDLKPENVLLQSSGHVLLTDFDLSRPLISPIPPIIFPLNRHCRPQNPVFFPAPAELRKAKSSRVSPESRAARSHSFVGTEEYVSPEIITGDGHDFAVDWWALGILAYEMSYGRTPFRGRNRKETFRNALTMKPEFVGNYPSELTDLIARLLAKEPEKRLGYCGGAEEVKAHPFFDGLRWEMLADVGRPPFLATAEEIEEGEVRVPDVDGTVGFDVRDYFKKLRRREEVTATSPASVSLTEF